MALEQERKVYRFLQGYGESLLSAMDKKQAFELMCPGGVHPAWIFGHLATAGHVMAVRAGGAAVLTDEARWKKLFGGGTVAATDPADYPAFDELVAMWKKAHASLDAAVAAAGPELLAQPNPNTRLAQALPTMGDMLAFFMTGHEGTHLGQLSSWRRVKGMPPLF